MASDFPPVLEPIGRFACGTARLAVGYYRHSSALQLSRDFVFAVFVYRHVRKAVVYVYGRGIVPTAVNVYQYFARKIMNLIMQIPSIRRKVDTELATVLKKVEDEMIPRGPDIVVYSEIPEKGVAKDQVFSILGKNKAMKHTAWEDGRVSGGVYHGGDDLAAIQTEAYGLFSIANQLHPDVFPGVRKIESETVSMVLKLYNAPESGCGTSTSGGTESLLMACLSAREKAYRERGVTEPEILCPITAHAGFSKAAFYFNMKLVLAPVDPESGKVCLKSFKRLINSNTVILAGSAPNFPHGIIDDIEGMSELALKYNIPLHVDACLGSFIVPFLKTSSVSESSSKVPLFDFRVPGVTSISCDTHKYGFAPKGSSIIMYRTEELRAYQYYVWTEWTGGVYASPTLAGSRPGALMVGCWATLMTVGKEGYQESCNEIVGAAMTIKHRVREEIPELKVVGDPIASVVAFRSDLFNIYDLADEMSKEGWHLNALQSPAAVHIACTRLTLPVVDEFITTLKKCVAAVIAKGSDASSASGTAALYGVAGSIKTAGVAEKIAIGFIDNLYKL